MADGQMSAQTTQGSASVGETTTSMANNPGLGNTVMEVDDNIDENDSAFGDNESIASSMTSLTSGITRYREENGRRYHAYRDGAYLLPNDEAEQDRLDLHHHVFLLAFGGKLSVAPIQNPSKVLDIGTGTGIWAIDYADTHPESHVIGWDLSPIQPGWVPPNLEFQVDDAEDSWPDKKYDYIHIRSLAGSIKDWNSLLAQCHTHLNPGGWIECIEFEVWIRSDDDTLKDDSMIVKWQMGLKEAAEKIGRTFDVAMNLKEWVGNAGFVDVSEKVQKIPTTPWAKNRRLKELGIYQQQNMLDASSSYGAAHFTRVLGWSNEEFLVLSAGVKSELKNPKIHTYANLYAVCGRKA